MADKDVALTLIGATVAIAGLVLVYSAFLLTKAGGFSDTRRAGRFVKIARWGLVPVISALICALLAVRVLLPGHWASAWAGSWLILTFEILLAITGVYAIIAAFVGM